MDPQGSTGEEKGVHNGVKNSGFRSFGNIEMLQQNYTEDITNS